MFDVIGKTFAGYRLGELIEAVLVGDKTREQAVAEFGGDAVDPDIRSGSRSCSSGLSRRRSSTGKRFASRPNARRSAVSRPRISSGSSSTRWNFRRQGREASRSWHASSYPFP